MEATVQEWLNLAVRWAHVIAAIMWIGDSFLFMWMDTHLEKPTRPRQGEVLGELWMTHGGGFYEVVKRKSLRPDEIPERLYWFKWESYSTWITGFFLISVVYYFGGQALLARPDGPLGHWGAVSLSLALLLGGVVLYDLLGRTRLIDHPRALGVIGLAGVMALAWGLSFVFTERAVFLQVGAMIASVMSSNVLLRIIPAQRHMMAATRAGTPVDSSYGLRAKKHSTHNHYLTLPVLFMMLSNHFPSVYGTGKGWLALGLLTVVGAGVKVFMNKRLQMPKLQLAGTAVALGAVIFITLPASAKIEVPEGTPRVGFAAVDGIVKTRCESCHATRPSNPAFVAPPNGIILETPEQIAALKDRIFARVVATQTMPLGNLTGMTQQERDTVAAWIAQGADPEAPGNELVPARALSDQAVAASSSNQSPAEAAAALYRARCLACHGPQGDGDGPAANALLPPPRRFAETEWQAAVTDEHLAKVIVGGGAAVGKSPAMPPNQDLEAQPEVVNALVALIRSFGHQRRR